MVKPIIIEEKPITMAGLKKELESIKEKYNELNFRSGRTLEYLNEFVPEKEKVLLELHEKLVKLNIPRLREEHICKIVDILPKSADELKTVLQGYTLTVNNENLKKIADAINSVIKK